MKNKYNPNLEFLSKQVLHNPEVLNKVVEVIKEEFPNDVKEYHQKIKAKLDVEASRAVHKLRHVVNLLNLKGGDTLTLTHENNLLKMDYSLCESFEEVLVEIKEFLNTLS